MMMDYLLLGGLLVLCILSFSVVPRVSGADGFFRGLGQGGAAPGLWTLTLSQVTTWIFARSLLTAAVLAYYYGVAGALAYTAYYLSFVTGGLIIDRLRFHHGASSVQNFLRDHFGALGPVLFNFVIILRLLSEVFANLLVVGLIFGATGSAAFAWAIIIASAITLVYSMYGGLSASLRTDVLQMSVFSVLLVVITGLLLLNPAFDFIAAATTDAEGSRPGWVLLLVALLQVISYPMHDPVMMDRGFIADRRTTARSFLLAAVISMVCIFVFALFGIFVREAGGDGGILPSLEAALGATPAVLVKLALIVSAVSTLDSTLSSSAKLAVVDMRLAPENLKNGRIAMALVMLGGLGFLFLGSSDLYAATAVSGTASMFLLPVIIFNVLMDIRVPRWSYGVSFAAAMTGASAYMMQETGRVDLAEILGLSHKYELLLVICIAISVTGLAAFIIGAATHRQKVIA